MQKLLLAAALALGILIGYIDSRPTWNDTGITVGVLLLLSFTLGAIAPDRPWRWALALGIWVPIIEIVTGPNYGSLAALAIAFAGAYGGALLRRALATS